MNDFMEIMKDIFGFIGSFQIWGIPYIYIVLGIALIGLIMNFIKGERK